MTENERQSRSQAIARVATETMPSAVPAPDMDDAAVIAAYSRWAPVYDFVFGLTTLGGRRTIARFVNHLPPAHILEAGVGTGLALPRYGRMHRVFGIDLSTAMLQRARRRVARRHLDHVEALEEMDAGHLALPDASFDVIIASYLMTVVPEPQRVMSEFVRVAKPGAQVLFINHFASRNWYRFVEQWLSRFASRIGWHPDVPMERFTNHPNLKLVETRTVGPFRLFTLLVFERV